MVSGKDPITNLLNKNSFQLKNVVERKFKFCTIFTYSDELK